MTEPFIPTFRKYNRNMYILVEGIEKADCFYIIQQGKVRITRNIMIKGERDEILNAGDFFGVISAMSGHNHIETAQALTDVVLISVRLNQYPALIQKSSQVAVNILKYFSRRLRHLNKLLAQYTLKNIADIGSSHLFNVAEYYNSQSLPKLALHAYSKYIEYCPSGNCIAQARAKIEEIKRTNPAIMKSGFAPDSISRTYEKNTMLFAEGEPGEEFFIIQSGSVKISKIVDYKEIILAILESGDITGEMALLEGKPRDACAIAYENTAVRVVNKANFEMMINSQPRLVARVTTLLSERIWLIYKQLANSLIDDPVYCVYDALLIHLEKNKAPLNSRDSYTFNFGQSELVNMVGLPKQDGMLIVDRLIKGKKIKILGNKIQVASVVDFVKQVNYYKKMASIKKAEHL